MWLGRALAVGDDVALGVAMPDPWCVMTTVAQEGLERDPNILRALAKHNRIGVAGGGLYPCAGLYTVVASPGTLRKGDRVAVT